MYTTTHTHTRVCVCLYQLSHSASGPNILAFLEFFTAIQNFLTLGGAELWFNPPLPVPFVRKGCTLLSFSSRPYSAWM